MAKLRVKWSVNQVRSARERYSHLIAKANVAPEAGITSIAFESIFRQDDAGTPEDLLLCEFLRDLFFLEMLGKATAKWSASTRADADRAFANCQRILSLAGVDPSRSSLSFMHRDLFNAQTLIDLRSGNHKRAAWMAGISSYAIYRPEKSDRDLNATTTAAALLRNGLVSQSLILLRHVEASNHNDLWCNTMAEALWLSGDREGCIKTIQGCTNPDSDKIALPVIFQALQQDNWQAIGKFVKDPDTSPGAIPAAYLWTFAHKSPQHHKALPRIGYLRRVHNSSALSGTDGQLLRAAMVIEEAYDNSRPLMQRLQRLGEQLQDSSKILMLSGELLVLAALVRYAMRYSQSSLYQSTLSMLQMKCEGLLSGRRSSALEPFHDPLGVTTDLLNKTVISLGASTFPEIPSDKFGRAAKLTKLAVTTAGKLASARISGLFLAEQKSLELMERTRIELGVDLLDALATMKGGFMKIGQIISYTSNAPLEIRTALENLQGKSLPLDPQASRRIVEEDFGRPIEELFAEWEDLPVATGSIGQVFRARLFDGTEVAVKVQYPGIEKAIRNDLDTMAMAKPLLRHLLPMADHDALLTEVKEQIFAETDYSREAANQESFCRIFSADPFIRIPNIQREFCSRRVLTMEFVRGRTFGEFVHEATQEERNQATMTIMRMFAQSFALHHKFNADPHPGNYIFGDDGTISFIDFGCVKNFSNGFVASHIQGVESILNQDHENNRKVWLNLGYVKDMNNFDFEEMFRVFTAMYEPMLHDKVVCLDPGGIEKMVGLQMQTHVRKQISPPPESAMFIRFTAGLWVLLGELRPELNFHRLFKNSLQAFRTEKHNKAG